MQWAYHLSLPSHIWNHEATQDIIHEVAVTVFLFNDLVSLKKEVVDSNVDSTIPILVWNEGISAQDAVFKAQKMMEESWEKLLAAERRLGLVSESEQIKHDLAVLVDGCKDVTVGHMAYALRALRYKTGVAFDGKDNGFSFVL